MRQLSKLHKRYLILRREMDWMKSVFKIVYLLHYHQIYIIPFFLDYIWNCCLEFKWIYVLRILRKVKYSIKLMLCLLTQIFNVDATLQIIKFAYYHLDFEWLLVIKPICIITLHKVMDMRDIHVHANASTSSFLPSHFEALEIYAVYRHLHNFHV